MARQGVLVLSLLSLVVGCAPAPSNPPQTTNARLEVRPIEAPLPQHEEPSQPAVVEALTVPGDITASIVRSNAPPRIVFLPGLCSNANAYLQNFPEAAKKHGGVVAIEGDQPCVPGFRSFSWDAAKQHARIDAALAAAGTPESERDGITLVGYSQGAAIGEQLVQRWPNRYVRIVLIGAPTEPSAAKLKSARALVTMACSRDVTGRMRDAARRTSAVGVPSTYLEMPGCTHGNIADGERVFDTAFDFLAANERID
jgi:pimeloyl-ACP methyl ester carboxylesterase